MSFQVGTLVRTRGREWVVLPDSEEDFLVLRPLGGTEAEIAGVLPALEPVEEATFPLPDPNKPGDHLSCRLLRDAVRLGFRSSAGPFRSFGRYGFDPRPYQLVPLLMALKLDPVRLLIADDVGIGKTIEAGMIVRELIDRGEVKRFAVLCPPQLAEQWHRELAEKFHLDAQLVLSSTAKRLESARQSIDETIFDIYPYVVISTDFIKAKSRRMEFLRSCPELVIVDEAHTCVSGGGRGVQQRYDLVSGLADDSDRHMILVTATPHSGKDDAFRALITLLNSEFSDLPEDLAGKENEAHRRRLARYFVLRRRVNIEKYLGESTRFPERVSTEEYYDLSPEYRKLFDRVIDYARTTVQETDDGTHRQRVRWWAAISLLRALGSSPAAAVSTLKNRASSADTTTVEEADEIGEQFLFDQTTDDSSEGTDVAPGADFEETEDDDAKHRRRLREMAKDAGKLAGEKDRKLQRAIELVKDLIKDGFSPILFCKFIPTAEYLADHLRAATRGVEVSAVTGLLNPEEREARIKELGSHDKRVLVATDCLSEGINLQDHFDAVVHYDLAWNPTRHEQREGRVDRFGQEKETIRVITYYGRDNPIDGIVLDVLLRKHQKIRSSLGISVAVPFSSEDVMEAVFEGLLVRRGERSQQQMIAGFDEYFEPEKTKIHQKWDEAKNREQRNRSIFAQETIEVGEVERELGRARDAVGSETDLEFFVKTALVEHGAIIGEGRPIPVNLDETPKALRELLGVDGKLKLHFDRPAAGKNELYLTRTHPFVEGLANHILENALDPRIDSEVAARCGVVITSKVEKRTTVLLVRFRFHIISKKRGEGDPMLAEDSAVLAFRGSGETAEWLSREEAEDLIRAVPERNVPAPKMSLQQILDRFEPIRERLEQIADDRAEELKETHSRVREEARGGAARYEVSAQHPIDVLGVYLYLPKTT